MSLRTKMLWREAPEEFTACMVTHAQTLAQEKGNSTLHDELFGGLADIFFAWLAEVSLCSQFSLEPKK